MRRIEVGSNQPPFSPKPPITDSAFKNTNNLSKEKIIRLMQTHREFIENNVWFNKLYIELSFSTFSEELLVDFIKSLCEVATETARDNMKYFERFGHIDEIEKEENIMKKCPRLEGYSVGDFVNVTANDGYRYEKVLLLEVNTDNSIKVKKYAIEGEESFMFIIKDSEIKDIEKYIIKGY